MKIAYILLAYKKPEQIIRLVQRLNTEDTHFFLHIDRKTDERIYQQIVEGLSNFSNVQFLERHKFYWGGFGHIQASMKGINALLEQSIPFDYCILLTEQDYPIKSNREIQRILSQNPNKSYLQHYSFPAPHLYRGGIERLRNWHFHLFGRYIAFPAIPTGKHYKFLPFPKRKFLEGFQPFGGSSYWCLSRESVEYIYHFVQENPQVVNYFKYVFISDEVFYQTILLNSPLRYNIVNDDLRFIKWVRLAPNPLILGEENLNEMLSSSKLFARKFDYSQGAKLLDTIDREILNEKVLNQRY